VIKVVTDANTLGVGTAQFYIDGVIGATLGGPTNVYIAHDEELAIGFGIQNGEAVAKTMTVEAVGYICER
jgi:hypothetical protein